MLRRQLRRGMEVAGNMRPALSIIADEMMDSIRATFESQGRRGGGSWKALDPATVKRKAAAGLDPRILIATGELMDSMTVRGDPNQILRIGRAHVELSSRLADAPVHQYGNEHVPARPFIKITTGDRKRWVNVVRDQLREAMVGV